VYPAFQRQRETFLNKDLADRVSNIARADGLARDQRVKVA